MSSFRAALLCGLVSLAASGADYSGSVQAGGLPVPGVEVAATRDGAKVVTTTDEAGNFTLKGLSDGQWTLSVRHLGFVSITRLTEIPSPSGTFDLKFASTDELLAALNPGPPGRGPRPQMPSGPRTAASGPPQGFQRLDVTQSADTPSLTAEGGLRTEEASDLGQSAANSFVVQGSVSTAANIPQHDDWGFGGRPFGMGMDGAGMIGPGASGLEQGRGEPPAAGAAPGGFRGMGGGPGGGPGFGRGPGGGPPGGFSGRGGPQGRDGRAVAGRRPDWQGRGGSTSFGNNRRNARPTLMGSAFFSLNNDSLDARQFSVTGAPVDKPSYTNARFGAMLGGALRIPKLIDASRQIMFSLDYQRTRNRNGVVSDPVNMPTALERAGDFSQTTFNGVPVTITDPTTGAPFPGNRIPADRMSATSAGLLQFFPNPNLPFAVRNYQTSWTGENDSQNLNFRLMNVRVGKRDRFSGAFGYQSSSTTAPNIFGFIDNGSGRGVTANVAWSRNITARLINNVNVNFNRMRQGMDPWFANVRNVAGELGIPGTSQDPINWGPPTLRFNNYAGLTDAVFSLGRNQTASVGETLMWIRGRHNMTFGVTYRRMQQNILSDSNGRGTWSFNGSATGYDLADFLLGVPTTASIRYGNPDKYFRNSTFDAFVNNDFRISPKLTLNVGVRYDYTTPVSELYGRLVNLDIAPGFSAIAPAIGRTVNPDRNNVSPRLGFAWRPSTRDSAVVRGGYGVYYNTSIYNSVANNLAQQPPFAQVLNVSSTAASPLSVANGFLLAVDPMAANTYAIDPNYRIGYVQTWTLSVQHDLPLGMYGTVGYLGTKGTGLDQLFLPNSVAPGAAPSNLPTGYLYQTSNGNSIYHAAQFQLNRRFRSGFGANASYQWSKAIDNGGTGGRGQGGTPIAQNWLDLSAERGLSSFDSRHNLSIMGQYSTGMGLRGGTLMQGWKGKLLKDWTVSSMITLRSGNPFTPVIGGVRSQVAGTAVTGTVRANATGLPVSADGMLFNPAAFTAPAPGTWGNAGRGTIPGPTAFFLNGGVGRIFRLGERRSVDIQMQAQNLLNHVVITGWGTTVDSINYGLATNAAGMRRMTLNVRFRF